ncbi:MAG: phosphopantothenoylcysteine decarboxylase [Verrucomicrobiota bacterium]
MKVIITCGPSFEPIDEVRRITNFSTGELGVLLANRLTRDGHSVVCLKGIGATYPGAVEAAQVIEFSTNDDLLNHLRTLARTGAIGALFHASALCDFKVRHVADAGGDAMKSAKISSRVDSLTIHLEPAAKVITELRALFPQTWIVGWKYELNGDRADALAKGWRQIRENNTDACIVNGRAFGPGFGCCFKPDRLEEVGTKTELVEYLARMLRERA